MVRPCLSLLVALAWTAPAGANPDTPERDYLLTQPGAGRPTGARFEFSSAVPLPIGADGIFTGGQMATTGLVTTRRGGGMMTTTGPAIWPPLLIRPAPTAVTTGFPTPGKRIRQAATTPQGGAVMIPNTVLMETGTLRNAGVYRLGGNVYDVATTLSYQWPQSTATLAPGGGPAPSVGVFTAMGPGGGTITYSRPGGVGKSFGGPAFFALQPGPNAGTRFIPPGAGMLPIATIFANAQMTPPTMAAFVGVVAASTGGAGRAAPGGSTTVMTSFGPVASGLRPVNQGVPTCTMWCLGPNGTVMGAPMDPTTITTWSVGPGIGPFTHNDGTSRGFPWTTGFVTVYAPGALGGVTFFLVGGDGRGGTGTGMTGVGNLSLVSGALGTRNFTGAHANRGWLSLNLPEPGAALGAAGALGVLALCHALARRSRERRER